MKTVISVLIFAAQWFGQPTVGIPRTAAGKVDLSAPAPRMPDGKPDLSGMWQMNLGFYVVNVTQDLDAKDIHPSAEARSRQHLDNFAKDPVVV